MFIISSVNSNSNTFQECAAYSFTISSKKIIITSVKNRREGLFADLQECSGATVIFRLIKSVIKKCIFSAGNFFSEIQSKLWNSLITIRGFLITTHLFELTFLKVKNEKEIRTSQA